MQLEITDLGELPSTILVLYLRDGPREEVGEHPVLGDTGQSDGCALPCFPSRRHLYTQQRSQLTQYQIITSVAYQRYLQSKNINTVNFQSSNLRLILGRQIATLYRKWKPTSGSFLSVIYIIFLGKIHIHNSDRIWALLLSKCFILHILVITMEYTSTDYHAQQPLLVILSINRLTVTNVNDIISIPSPNKPTLQCF